MLLAVVTGSAAAVGSVCGLIRFILFIRFSERMIVAGHADALPAVTPGLQALGRAAVVLGHNKRDRSG